MVLDLVFQGDGMGERTEGDSISPKIDEYAEQGNNEETFEGEISGGHQERRSSIPPYCTTDVYHPALIALTPSLISANSVAF